MCVEVEQKYFTCGKNSILSQQMSGFHFGVGKLNLPEWRLIKMFRTCTQNILIRPDCLKNVKNDLLTAKLSPRLARRTKDEKCGHQSDYLWNAKQTIGWQKEKHQQLLSRWKFSHIKISSNAKIEKWSKSHVNWGELSAFSAGELQLLNFLWIWGEVEMVYRLAFSVRTLTFEMEENYPKDKRNAIFESVSVAGTDWLDLMAAQDCKIPLIPLDGNLSTLFGNTLINFY